VAGVEEFSVHVLAKRFRAHRRTLRIVGRCASSRGTLRGMRRSASAGSIDMRSTIFCRLTSCRRGAAFSCLPLDGSGPRVPSRTAPVYIMLICSNLGFFARHALTCPQSC